MFIIINYTKNRIVLLKYSNNIDVVLDYFTKNTATNKKVVTKSIVSNGFYEKSNIYIISTSDRFWSNNRMIPIVYDRVSKFIKSQLRNIKIEELFFR